MTLSQFQPYISIEEYLQAEKSSPIKHEYIQGQIYAMAGASDAHVTIAANLVALLRNHIRGTGCRIYVWYYINCSKSGRENQRKESIEILIFFSG